MKDGPAFPTVVDETYQRVRHEAGMTKREYFAAKAMQGLLTADTEMAYSHEHIARLAVEQADALIAELEKDTP